MGGDFDSVLEGARTLGKDVSPLMGENFLECYANFSLGKGVSRMLFYQVVTKIVLRVRTRKKINSVNV